MGAFDGSLTFKTFFVDGEPPNDFHDGYLKRIEKFAFKTLTPESEDDRSIGWVSTQLPLEAYFKREHVFHNQFICFALRIDTWSIPSTLLKAHLAEATREYCEANDMPRVGRREREMIRDQVTANLKRRLIPALKIVDVVWDTQSRTVRFWTHSAALNEEFQELFEDTFELKLVPDSPYSAAMALDLGDEMLERLGELTPSWFVEPVEDYNDDVEA